MSYLCPAGIIKLAEGCKDPCIDCNLYPCAFYENMDDNCEACKIDLDDKKEE